MRLSGKLTLDITSRDGRRRRVVSGNTITAEGMAAFWAASEGYPTVPETSIEVGFADSAGFTGFDPSDTLASHPGWTEATVESSLWDMGTAFPAVVSGDNLSASMEYVATVTNNGSDVTVAGVFITTPDSGVLWATIERLTLIENGDEVIVTYTITIEADLVTFP